MLNALVSPQRAAAAGHGHRRRPGDHVHRRRRVERGRREDELPGGPRRAHPRRALLPDRGPAVDAIAGGRVRPLRRRHPPLGRRAAVQRRHDVHDRERAHGHLRLVRQPDRRTGSSRSSAPATPPCGCWPRAHRTPWPPTSATSSGWSRPCGSGRRERPDPPRLGRSHLGHAAAPARLLAARRPDDDRGAAHRLDGRRCVPPVPDGLAARGHPADALRHPVHRLRLPPRPLRARAGHDGRRRLRLGRAGRHLARAVGQPGHLRLGLEAGQPRLRRSVGSGARRPADRGDAQDPRRRAPRPHRPRPVRLAARRHGLRRAGRPRVPGRRGLHLLHQRHHAGRRRRRDRSGARHVRRPRPRRAVEPRHLHGHRRLRRRLRRLAA